MENLIHFYCFILQKMKNPLIMNLFGDCLLFLGFPYISGRTLEFYSFQTAQKRLQHIIQAAYAKDWKLLDEGLSAFWNEFAAAYTRSIEPCILPVPEDQQTVFTWRIYSGRPQIYYNLATHLMYEIYLGSHRDQQFLPSYEKMAETYDVSVNTVRRTIRLLSQLGVIRPINGKGIRIFSFGEQTEHPDLTIPAIRRSLILFRHAFELLFYTGEEIVKRVLSAMSREERVILLNQMRSYIEVGNGALAPWCIFNSIASLAPLQGLNEIYTKIFSLSLWGYPLKTSYGGDPNLDKKLARLKEA